MSSSKPSSIRGGKEAQADHFNVKDAPASHGRLSFFDKTPPGNAARGVYLKTVIGGTFMMIILIFTILAIYWAALYRTPVRNLHGWVVVCLLPLKVPAMF
jgi:hypothetical protein